MISVINIYGNTDRWLSMEADDVRSENNKWTFSSISPSKTSPLYKLYGDSLITEIWRGARQWYAIDEDSIVYIGEETRFHNVFFQRPIPTSAFGNRWHADEVLSKAEGHYYHSLELGLDGNYKSSLPIKGKIIIEENINFPATAVTETKEFTSHIGHSLSAAKSSVSRHISRTRWFIDGDILPVAMQITEKEFLHGKEISSETDTYLVDFSELPIYENFGKLKKIQQALDNVDIINENGKIIIKGNFPHNTILKLYMSNLQGNLFHQEPIEVIANVESTVIPIPHIATGQYIVTISAGTPTNRKIIITI